ncbi:MAG: formylmethanofuran dehydrogenase subunit E family protein, partial [Candidatus Omnitrophota bacterium]|nr:formylmethanofuran dehydrogenase subunit E family protein [Candidatus Omnitrophota bacterium]
MSDRLTLVEAKKFHGHLGPYLVLGILAGELVIKRFRCKKYFDLEVKVWGANRKPKSCLIDGLQLSTGATYGKGNIRKFDGPKIKIEFCNSNNNRKLILRFREVLIQRLKEAKT